MDPFNTTIMALIAADRERTLLDRPPHLAEAIYDAPGGRGLRCALARTLVRLGLRLHPAAGEGLLAPRAEARS